nr:hypothetical protein [Bacillota bacterium]
MFPAISGTESRTRWEVMDPRVKSMAAGRRAGASLLSLASSQDAGRPPMDWSRSGIGLLYTPGLHQP